ncbi:MAG: hypothetical protein QOH56_378 [Pseudonocardiales bacterium]|nr:hypothetical protein [Pseudonocardiales bacterium]
MSQRLIARSLDLLQLQEEGYDLHIESDNVLLVRGIPYVNANQQVLRGTLVTALELAGDVTVQPASHELYFAGEAPCTRDGAPLHTVIAGGAANVGVVPVNFMFSKKPLEDGHRYRDYHHKMTTYVALLSVHAEQLEPDVTARTFPVIPPDDPEESVFEYADTASVRAGTSEVTEKLKTGPVAIVGLGGTGAYVLDLVAKTPVSEIHLFDGDRFVQHNAFRSPGAPSRDKLATVPQKVDYFADLYRPMRRYIVPHDTYVTEDNVESLRGMSFVFLTVDKGSVRKMLVSKLEEFDLPFIDVGIGVEEVDGALTGQVRTTTSTPQHREHVHEYRRIPFGDPAEKNDYKHNVQIADLNALNATLAVIKWKKLAGFYADMEREHYSVYAVSGNTLLNEDQT